MNKIEEHKTYYLKPLYISGRYITNDKKQLIREYIDSQDKEIERLNNIINEYKINTIPTLEHNIDVLVEQEDRANNIINELEKWSEEYRFANIFKNKLQELKGDGSND